MCLFWSTRIGCKVCVYRLDGGSLHGFHPSLVKCSESGTVCGWVVGGHNTARKQNWHRCIWYSDLVTKCQNELCYLGPVLLLCARAAIVCRQRQRRIQVPANIGGMQQCQTHMKNREAARQAVTGWTDEDDTARFRTHVTPLCCISIC
jgi:hypothetical protein